MADYICDIDGTIADLSHRLHFIERKPKDWESFFAAVHKDRPIEHMRSLLHAIEGEARLVNRIIYVTGRPERTRRATEWWLEEHDFPVGTMELFMRRDGDRRQDHIVKLELLGQLKARGYEPVMSFDDRQQVVDMWRAMGVPCLQVAPGRF